MSKPTINEEIKKLCGIGPRYNFTESVSTKSPEKPIKDPANVASKEYEGAPETKKEGGDAGGNTSEKDAKVGGYSGGPGINNKMTRSQPAEKEGGEKRDGGGMKAAEVGGAKGGPGQNFNTKRADSAEKEGGYRDAGGGAKEPKAGGAKSSEATKKDDGLRAENRDARMTRMKELIAIMSEDDEIEEEADIAEEEEEADEE